MPSSKTPDQLFQVGEFRKFQGEPNIYQFLRMLDLVVEMMEPKLR